MKWITTILFLMIWCGISTAQLSVYPRIGVIYNDIKRESPSFELERQYSDYSQMIGFGLAIEKNRFVLKLDNDYCDSKDNVYFLPTTFAPEVEASYRFLYTSIKTQYLLFPNLIIGAGGSLGNVFDHSIFYASGGEEKRPSFRTYNIQLGIAYRLKRIEFFIDYHKEVNKSEINYPIYNPMNAFAIGLSYRIQLLSF